MMSIGSTRTMEKVRTIIQEYCNGSVCKRLTTESDGAEKQINSKQSSKTLPNLRAQGQC